MHTLAIVGGKGGVGKTSIAFELSHLLAADVRRVIALDFDPQASLTAFYGQPTPPLTIADVLTTGAPIAQAVTPTGTDNLSMIASGGALVAAELVIAGRPMRREEALKRAVAPLAALCDVLLIDCAPALGLLTLCALVASDGALVITRTEAAALGTLRATLAAVEQVQTEANGGLKLLGIVANDVAQHLNHHREALDVMRAERLPIVGVIPRTIAMANTPAMHKPITTTDRTNPAAAALINLYGVILKWQRQPKNNN